MIALLAGGLPVSLAAEQGSLQISRPIDAGYHLKENGWAGISFFYHQPKHTEGKVRLQVSLSLGFEKTVLDIFPQGSNYFWRTNRTGSFYWRLILEDGHGKALASSEVRSFIIVPEPVMPVHPTRPSLSSVPPEGITFLWRTREPQSTVKFYRFKLSKERAFDHPLINTDIKETSYHLKKLEPGDYFWKVGVKFKHEIPLRYSEVKDLKVTKSTTLAILAETDATGEDKVEGPENKSVTANAATGLAPRASPAPAQGEAPPPSSPTQGEVSPPPAPAQGGVPPPPVPAPALAPKSKAAQIEVESSDADLEDALPSTNGVSGAKGQRKASALSSSSEGPASRHAAGSKIAKLAPEDRPQGPQKKKAVVVTKPTTARKPTAPPAPPPPAPPPPAPPPPAPDLAEPADQAKMETFDRAMALWLQWKTDGAQNKFITEIASDPRFVDSKRLASDERRLSITLPVGTWYWRVKAVGEKGKQGNFSSTRSFMVLKPSVHLAPRKPAPGEEFTYIKNPPPIAFAWQASPLPSSGFTYRLHVARDDAWREMVIDREIKDNAITLDELGEGNYFWRIGLKFAGEPEMIYSENGSFTVTKKKEAPPPPQLISPNEGAKIETVGDDAPVKLRWKAPEGSRSFVIQVATDGQFADAEMMSALKEELDTVKPAGRFYWRVKAMDATGEEGSFSAARSFEITRNKVALTLRQPTAGAQINTFKVGFVWRPFKGCVSYELLVSANANMDKPSRKIATQKSKLETELDDEDTYYWSVECTMKGGRKVKSPSQSFKISVEG